MGALFQSAPAVMLCKPTNYDRWDRRAVELAAFVHLHGHSNVPLVILPLLCPVSALCPRHRPQLLYQLLSKALALLWQASSARALHPMLYFTKGQAA